MSRIFGPIRQVAYVTPDIGKAMADFIGAGIGPWFHAARWRMEGLSYRGETIALDMALGLANSGGVQIELIQPLDTTPSIYTEWLARFPGRTLVQHFCSWPTDYDGVTRAAGAAGYRIAMAREGSEGGLAYFEHPDFADFTFEVCELTDARRRRFDGIARAAENWDGGVPIRDYPGTLDMPA